MKKINRDWNVNNRERRRELIDAWQGKPEYRDYKFNYNLLYNYNITIDDYIALLAKQDGHCATCPAIEPTTGRTRRFHVDHDHSCCPIGRSCGKCIRGLLCTTCNLTLGALQDNAATLQRMIDYLASGGTRGQKFIEEQVEEYIGL